MAGVVEAANGAFDLDATVSPCAICMSPRGDLVVASCGNLRHGACRSCLKMALTQPARRHPIGRGDGAMGCVAAGCGGSFDLRSLLGALDDAKDKGHVLKIVADLRKKETAPAPAAAKTSAAQLGSKRKQFLAACGFLRKPDIAKKPAQAVDEYLSRNGVPSDVLAAARACVAAGDDPAATMAFVEAPAAPAATAVAGGSSHAPAFDFSAAAADIDAISGENELIGVDGADLASLVSKLESTKKKATKRAIRDKLHARADDCARDLEQSGWACVDGFCDENLTDAVRGEIDALEPFYDPSEIWVGAESTVGAQVNVPSVRGDKVLWMCGGHPRAEATADFSRGVAEKGGVEPCDGGVKDKFSRAKAKAGATRLSRSQVALFPKLRDLFRAVDAFVLQILAPKVPHLADVSSRSDGMLAIYPGDGSRFQAHVDNTTQDGRRLTVLCYLNSDWDEAKGGALRVHPTSGPRDILPKAGRLAMFFSDSMKHEVRPTWAPRTAITLWYYGAAERRAAVERAKDEDANPVAISATDEERGAARDFAKQLCAPGAEASPAAVRALADACAELPDNARKILAGMAGVPDMVVALSRLLPGDLVKLRERFANMGV